MSISAPAVAYTAVGGLVLLSGIKGATLADTAKAVLKGNLTLANTEPIDSSGSSTAGGSVSGSAIVAAAQTFIGHKYVYGGPSNPTNGWDCSSFVSYILGSVIDTPIPGGSWASVTNSGASHGPTADEYKTWSGATSVAANSSQPGDLLCWTTHVGFAVDSTHMISALDTADGTIVSAWDGPTGEGSPTVRRVNATAVAATTSGSSSNSSTANQALAKTIIQSNSAYAGWDSGQTWTDLVSLWNKESGWNAKAKNSSSGAYGIPQALPETKMPSAAQESGGSEPGPQIEWGLQYIQGRYGSPVMAWAHEQANNWY
jgi:hypothetical protein